MMKWKYRKSLSPWLFLACFWVACTPTDPESAVRDMSIADQLKQAVHWSNSRPDSALDLLHKISEQAAVVEDQVMTGEVHLLMGSIYLDLGNLAQASQMLNRALTIFQEHQLKERIGDTYVLLSKIYQRSENYAHADTYLRNARDAFASENSNEGLAHVYGEIGHMFEKTQKYDSALCYQSKAIGYYLAAQDTLGQAIIHDNMGSIYEDLEDYDNALVHFKLAFALNESINNVVDATVNLNNLGDIYRKTGQLEKGLEYTHQALSYAESTHQDYQVKSACRDLSKAYALLGRKGEAYDYLERSYELTDSLFSAQIAEEIANTQAAYELQQKQTRIMFLEEQQKASYRLAILSVLGGAFVVIFGGLFYIQQRSKNQKVHKLLETKTELARIELQNAQLSEQNLKNELENKMLREQQLKYELELKSKSLTKSTLHLIQKNEFLDTLKHKLNGFKRLPDRKVNRTVRQLTRAIDLNFHVDDDWREFETIFQEIHSGFFDRLTKKYPDLTPAEIRLCAMIRLNMHSKEIAAIMGITADSLRTSRYRLRKKLEIERGENLYSFIRKIG